MIRKRKILLGIGAGILLCLLITAGVWLLRSALQSRLRDTAPLVLITSPHEEQQFAASEIVTVHATAREVNGLDTIELWLDGILVAEERVPDDTTSTMLVLHEGLQSMTAGAHEIVVRARSTWGASGQATSWFEVLDGGGAAGGDRTGSAAGPSGIGTGTGGEPGPVAPAPGSAAHMVDWLPVSSTYRSFERASEPILLQMEIIGLRTDQEYEGLHCYLGAAEVPPRWHPDTDYDQSTDESFASLGDGFWDVAAALSGESAPHFLWHTNEPIPLDITCVGVTGGGTDALELGSIRTSIDPEAWDGITRRFVSTSVEGSFALDLRIIPMDEAPSWHLLELDPEMTSPTNLRMGFYTLHWDYVPEEEEIDGFRIKLNGDVLWTESPDARESYLPYEWLSPPCGRTYTFTVDAIRGEDWSMSSNPVIIQGGAEGSDECDRTLILTFDMLETFLLPEDEGHDGWVGPLSGSFYAGEQEIRFDSHCSGSGYCDTFGIGDDEQVSISRLTSHWGPGPARFVLHVPPGESMVIGFEIRDHDAGGGSQVLCENWRVLEDRNLSGAIESSIGDYLDNCRVTFSLHPTLGSVVSDPEGPYPLPQLGVTELSVNDDTGQLRVHVSNFGSASWPAQDLDIALLQRDGTLYRTFTFEEPVMRPGETDVLMHPDLAALGEPPLTYCVVLDPDNRVPEEVDRTDIWSREPYCRPLPDLTITDVLIDEAAHRIMVTVRNIGEGSLFYRMVPIHIQFYDGGRPFEGHDFADVSLEPWESRVLIWEGVSQETLERTQGYSVVHVDNANHIAETNDDNNEYELPTGGHFRVRWIQTSVPYYLFSDGYGRHTNINRFAVQVRAEAGGSSRILADWHAPQGDEDCEVSLDATYTGRYHCQFSLREQIITLGGDESLVFDIRGDLTVGPYENGLGACIWDCEHSLGHGMHVLEPGEWAEAPECEAAEHPILVDSRMYSPDLHGAAWAVDFDLCRVRD